MTIGVLLGTAWGKHAWGVEPSADPSRVAGRARNREYVLSRTADATRASED